MTKYISSKAWAFTKTLYELKSVFFIYKRTNDSSFSVLKKQIYWLMLQLDHKTLEEKHVYLFVALVHQTQHFMRSSCAEWDPVLSWNITWKMPWWQHMSVNLHIHISSTVTHVQETHAMGTDTPPYTHRCWLLLITLRMVVWHIPILSQRNGLWGSSA